MLFQGYVYYSTLFPLLKDFLKKSSTWNKNLFLYRFASELFHVKQKAGRFETLGENSGCLSRNLDPIFNPTVFFPADRFSWNSGTFHGVDGFINGVQKNPHILDHKDPAL